MKRIALVLLAGGCNAPERIAANAGDVRTLAESSRQRFLNHDDPAGVQEQTAIIEKAQAISVDAARVDPAQPAIVGTLELGLWVALVIAGVVLLWQTGVGLAIRRMLGWIPARKRSAAKLLREAVEDPNQIREAVAAARTADPVLDAAWKTP